MEAAEISIVSRRGVGYTVLVDQADLEPVLAAGPWHVNARPDGYRNVRHSMRVNEGGSIKVKQILLHRWLLGVTDPAVQVDHKDGNPLDNRRKNLRIARGDGNKMNRGKYAACTSTYKGVHWFTPMRCWKAAIRRLRPMILGYYAVEEHAAWAYNFAAETLFVDYARPNALQALPTDVQDRVRLEVTRRLARYGVTVVRR